MVVRTATETITGDKGVYTPASSIARIRPILPSWIKSRKESPRFAYRFAILTTNRRLAWINSFFACWRSRTARFEAKKRSLGQKLAEKRLLMLRQR